MLERLTSFHPFKSAEYNKALDDYRDAINQVPMPFDTMPGAALPAAPKPTRPGDTAPKAYVGIARDVLGKQMDKHTDELVALDKDIEKLTEERRQVRITIDGMQAALTYMNNANSQQSELELEAVVAAEIDKHVFGDE